MKSNNQLRYKKQEYEESTLEILESRKGFKQNVLALARLYLSSLIGLLKVIIWLPERAMLYWSINQDKSFQRGYNKRW